MSKKLVSQDYYEMNSFDLDRILYNNDIFFTGADEKLVMLNLIHNLFDEYVDYEGELKRLVESVEGDSFTLEAIGFIKERNYVMGRCSLESDSTDKAEYIVVNSQRFIKINDKNRFIIEEAKKIRKEKDNDVKNAQIEKLMREREDLDAQIAQLKES